MLREGGRRNPGPWTAHSEAAADNARRIAERCPGMDADAAYLMGLLHDIGRQEGMSYLKHTLDGYRFLLGQGYPELAAICLTHSFQLQNMDTFMGRLDVSEEDYAFITRFVEQRDYDDYDRLIQLCDAVSVPGGGVLIEKRLLDVGVRYGVLPIHVEKWKATFALKRYFDEMTGTNIYRLLPNIVENTFEW